MPKAIPYIRFSSIKQVKGDSLERQEKLIRNYLVDQPQLERSTLTFQDLGLSGYKGKHLENDLGKLLLAIEEGHIVKGDYILIEAMDRLGRLPELEMLTIVQSILKHGIKLVTLQDRTEYSTESLAANSGLLYALAGKVQMSHQYSLSLAKRMQSVWEGKEKAARNGQGVKRKTPWWLTWNDNTQRYDLLTDTDKEILTNVFKWHLSGLGTSRIKARLMELDSERFSKTDPATIRRWLSNKTAIGYWQDIPNVYPAAIPEPLYYQVQKELKKRAGGKAQAPRSGHFLCGLIRCGCCGGNLSHRSNPHSQDTMVCSVSNRRKDKCANGSTIPVQVLDYLVHETFSEAIHRIEVNASSSESESELLVVRGQISELEQNLDNLVDLVAQGSKSVAKKVLILEDELEQLQAREADLLLSIRTPSEYSFSHFTQVGSEMKDDPELLNELLRKVNYHLTANGKLITYGARTWNYVKWDRVEDAYILNELSPSGKIIEQFALYVQRELTDEEKQQVYELEHASKVQWLEDALTGELVNQYTGRR